MHCWKDRAWPRLGVRAAAFFVCFSRWVILSSRSDEIFASLTGVVHPVHCLTWSDVALYKGERRLTSLQWHHATSIEVISVAITVTRPNRGRLSCAHATTPRRRVLG